MVSLRPVSGSNSPAHHLTITPRQVQPQAEPENLDSFTPAPATALGSLEDKLKATAARAAEIESQLGPRTPSALLVKLPAGLDQTAMKSFAEDYGAELKQVFTIPEVMKDAFNGELVLLQLGPSLSEAQAMAAMELDQRVLLTGTDDHMELFDEAPPQEPEENLPNDLHPEQWGLKNNGALGGIPGVDIEAGKAWTVTTGDRENGPIVAVIDSGIDAFHPDIRANMWRNPDEVQNGRDDDRNTIVDDVHGIDALNSNGNLVDHVGHGTHVAGVIGAVGNNGEGVAGINWESRLMGIKIADQRRVSLVGAVYGMLYAADKGARIANNSWGGAFSNRILEDVMRASPMLHVCAAGNGQRDTDQVPAYPASYDLPNVISVAASTRREEHLNFSNWGAESVDVHAPGAMVYSTLPTRQYGEESGTSMAAPHVAGVAALIATEYPEAGNQEIKDRILYSSEPIEAFRKMTVSGGRLNAHRALENDQVAPAEIPEFVLQKVDADGFEVSWKGVGDDGMEGVAARYLMEADYGDHKERLIPDFPQGPGAVERLTYRTPPTTGERPVSISLKAVDNVGNATSTLGIQTTLPAATTAFHDPIGADSNWDTEGNWGKVEVEGRGMVYTDTPEGDYEDGQDTSLVSPAFDLSNIRSARLSFDAQAKTQQWDMLFIEALVDDDSGDYEMVGIIRGGEQDREWHNYNVDLSQFDGRENVRIRFQFRTSRDGTDDGVYVDNVRVFGAEPTPAES